MNAVKEMRKDKVFIVRAVHQFCYTLSQNVINNIRKTYRKTNVLIAVEMLDATLPFRLHI